TITEDHSLFTIDESTTKLTPVAGSNIRLGMPIVTPFDLSACLDAWSQELTSLNVHDMPVQREGRIRKSSGIREGASCVNRLGGTRMPVEFPVTDDFLYVVGLWLAEGGKSATTYGVTPALSIGGTPGAVDTLSRFFLAYGVTPSKSLANDVDYSVCSAVF